MPAPAISPEDQLVENLVDLWDASPPSGWPADWPIYHYHRDAARAIPCGVIGHEGSERVPGMEGTVTAALRVLVISNKDITDDADHRAAAGALERALDDMTVKPGPLSECVLHALLKESPRTGIDEDTRQDYTELRRSVVCSLGEAG